MSVDHRGRIGGSYGYNWKVIPSENVCKWTRIMEGYVDFRLKLNIRRVCYLFYIFFLGFVGPKPMLGMEMAYLFGRAPGKLE